MQTRQRLPAALAPRLARQPERRARPNEGRRERRGRREFGDLLGRARVHAPWHRASASAWGPRPWPGPSSPPAPPTSSALACARVCVCARMRAVALALRCARMCARACARALGCTCFQLRAPCASVGVGTEGRVRRRVTARAWKEGM